MSDLFQLEAREAIAKKLTFHKSAPKSVDAEWTCQREGDCCTQIDEVVMTKEEAALLVHHAPSTVQMEFRPGESEHFVVMKAGPCPLYIFGECVVYAHRPYNCRRFICLRPDPKSEPFDGNKNWQSRVYQDRGMRRLYERNQRKAQRWARAHGWRESC